MFSQLVNELTLLLTYEATKDLADEEIEIETAARAHRAHGGSQGKKVAICPILRAGMGMLDGVLVAHPRARASASSASSATRRRSSPSSTT
jgi:uracil phosphoribosyltransferase